MIASVFSKSKPINFVLSISVFVLCFILLQSSNLGSVDSTFGVLKRITLLVILVGSTFIVNFIAKKNSLSKDNCFSFLIFLTLVLLLFPKIVVNTEVVVSNFFILLALRKLISLQSLISPKEKIFDASFWIFVAAYFHFYSILFILLVFISIVFHVSQDYRNWLIPFIALFTFIIIYVFLMLLKDGFLVFNLVNERYASYYQKDKFHTLELIFFVIITLLFLITQLFTVFGSKPVNLHASYKKIIFSFFIGMSIFMINPSKDNSYLIYTFASLAIMGANYMESLDRFITKDIVLYIFIGGSLVIFFSRL